MNLTQWIGRLCGIVAVLALVGCAEKPLVLEGAVNPDKLPVFPGAKMDPDQALAGAELDRAYYAKYWDLVTTASPEEVETFYREALPAVRPEVEKGEDGDPERTVFHWEFSSAEDGEYLEVVLTPGKIRLVECLRLGKHAEEF